jgi:hypothetical protein
MQKEEESACKILVVKSYGKKLLTSLGCTQFFLTLLGSPKGLMMKLQGRKSSQFNNI